ncbi:MAG: hypothetical protein EB090_02210, partial [Verrucomicrobia bacterium]|nr:hypothetical protein [Verrucomicrobiota bacterium]
MRTLQDWVYEVEAGSIRVWLVRSALFLFITGLTTWIGLREFNGLRTMEAMDLAQQARQLATGKGFTTQFIRPLALWQLRAKHGNQSPSLSEFPETLTPPLYPSILSGLFRMGRALRVISFDIPPEKVKFFRVYSPDYVPLALNLTAIVLSAFLVFLWGARQFDFGVGVLAVVFLLGSSALWDLAIQGGSSAFLVLLYAAAGWLFCGLLQIQDSGGENFSPAQEHLRAFCCGWVIALAPLVQLIQIWPCLVFLFVSSFCLRSQKWSLWLGALIPLGISLAWMGRMWQVTGNPLGLNWAFFLADSPNYPGNLVWRTFSYDVEKTDVWRRLTGSVLRGFSMIMAKGPMLCGATLAGLLAVVSLMHPFRLKSATHGKSIWGFVAFALILACSFVIRGEDQAGLSILIVLLPVSCVYGAAFLWVCIERLKFQIELLGMLLACFAGILACWSTIARLALPEPPPFSYPPNYPPIFVFMRSWFETGELQSSDLPWAESWYSNVPTLWIPST